MHFLREPLVQFLFLGAVLFGLHGAFTDASPEADDSRILISEQTLAWLGTVWEKQWGRPPTVEELQGQIDHYIREEILYREALAMGLDRDDTVVRRRLAQKVEFLAKDLGGLAEPTEDEIRRSFEANLDRYRQPEIISFAQVYVNADDRADAETDARALLADLREKGIAASEARSHGDRFLMPSTYQDQTHQDVLSQFGVTFAEELFRLEPGEWQGPVRSGFGLHLIRITTRTAGWDPPLEQVREAVELDLLEHRRQRALDEYLERLRSKYDVEVTAPAPTGDDA